MKRASTRRNAHNQTVRQIAEKLTRQKWDVKADIPGYIKPTPVGKGKKVPDIAATKQGHRRIIEVETPDTINRDRKQQQTFRRHAGQKPNTSFDIVVTD